MNIDNMEWIKHDFSIKFTNASEQPRARPENEPFELFCAIWTQLWFWFFISNDQKYVGWIYISISVLDENYHLFDIHEKDSQKRNMNWCCAKAYHKHVTLLLSGRSCYIFIYCFCYVSHNSKPQFHYYNNEMNNYSWPLICLVNIRTIYEKIHIYRLESALYRSKKYLFIIYQACEVHVPF